MPTQTHGQPNDRATRLGAAYLTTLSGQIVPPDHLPSQLRVSALCVPARAFSFHRGILAPKEPPTPERLVLHNLADTSGLSLRSYKDGLLLTVRDEHGMAITTPTPQQALTLHAWLGATIASRRWS